MMFRRIVSCFAIAAIAAASLVAEPFERSSVSAFDRQLMFPYSHGLDVASDLAQYAAFFSPALLVFASPQEDYAKIGLLCAGSSAIALGARFGLKAAFDRERPYMYFENPPADEIASGDSRKSFPSGHAIMAFSGAAFTATVLALEYPDSPYRVPITAAAFALAGTSAALRIASGAHFTSDVLAGALIGSAAGFAVPFVASKLGAFGDRKKNTVEASPLGFSIRMEL
jgi:undecaprenyl-diphosphatase